MIYISSSCIKNNTIKESVSELASQGYKNIELSGGTKYYDGFINDLLDLKEKYDLNYQLHNYFPPPKEQFILNIATFDQALFDKSISHCISAIKLSKLLGCSKYAIHAGFLIDFTPEEAGKKISLRKVNERSAAVERFAEAWELISGVAGEDVNLYIENNVYSQTNYSTYEGDNPFLLTDYNGYLELAEKIEFTPLLDLAHLKVSCNTLKLDFQKQSSQFMQMTDYLHVSGNDGLHDQNNGIENDLDIIEFLEGCDLFGKTITLEVYDGLESLRRSYNKLKSLKYKN